VYGRLADRTQVDLPPGEVWLLIRIGQIVPSSSAELAHALNVTPDRLHAALSALRHRGYVGAGPELTLFGRAAYEKLVSAREAAIEAYLADWPPKERAQMRDAIVHLAQRLLSDDFQIELRTTAERLKTLQART
jgi:DNA-binding MarR family transcriptional regulator